MIITPPPKVGITPDTRPYDGKQGADGQSTLFRYASTSSLTAPAYTANADNPGNNWYETPPVITATQYLWMIQSEWRGANRLTAWSAPVRISGTQGKDGLDAPRYRGAVSQGNADTNNTGQITTNQGLNLTMNHGDYVMYLGNNAGSNPVWRTGYIYQWDGNSRKWNERARPTSNDTATASMYWDAMNDLTANAPEMFVSTGFIRSLIADEAFIRYLFAKLIVMTSDGEIRSEGFTGIDGATPGFWLKAFDQATGGGLIEANNIKTKNMKAVNADVEGGLNAGKSFNADGSIIEEGTLLGGLLVRKDGFIPAQILNLKVFETLTFDKGRSDWPYIDFGNAKKRVQGSHTAINVSILGSQNNNIIGPNIIRGGFTLSALSNKLDELLGVVGISVALFGSISTTVLGGQYGGTAYHTTYNITFAYRGANYWTLYGQVVSSDNGGEGSLVSIELNTNTNAGVNLIFI
jgi:hypothetical protein